jgi:hypothetical protein
LFFAVSEVAKEMLVGVLQITQRLLKRLTVYLTQPGGCTLLLEPSEFGREIVVGQSFACVLKVVALPAQRPIPNPAARTRKLIEQFFLLGSRLEAITIGCLSHSWHGSSLPDQMFYCTAFSALEEQA